MNASAMRVAVGFCAGVLATVFYFQPPQDSGQWASWVQAFGSIGAILAAIWVLKQQNQNAIDRENDEIDQLLLSIRDEVTVLAAGFSRQGGVGLKAAPTGAFATRVPLSEHAFVIYHSSAGRIGKIKDHNLRQRIVVTYAKAFGFIKSIQLNNRLVEEYVSARWQQNQVNSPFNIADTKEKWRVLEDYGNSLRTSYFELDADVQQLLVELPKGENQ